MADSDQTDKTENASEHKLSEARKKGQVVKSPEVNNAIFTAVLILITLMLGHDICYQLVEVLKNVFMQSGQIQLDSAYFGSWLGAVFLKACIAIAPVIAVLFLASIASTVLQSGIVLSSHPLTPDFSKLNPISGLKKLVSIKVLFEAVKNTIKLIIISSIFYSGIKSLYPEIMSLLKINHHVYIDFFIEHFTSIALKILIVMICFGAIDYLFVNWDFLKKMRMSKQEVKEEHKRRDGDPKIKAKQREIQRQLRKKSEAVKKVPNADVIVTNPTRLAVLIKYDAISMRAPVVIGKASGKMVPSVKDAAYRYRVPVIEAKDLARKLFKMSKIDSPIHESLYRDVAKILKRSYRIKRGFTRKSVSTAGEMK